MSFVQARLFVTTGTPIQPHSTEGLEGLAVHFRWVLVPYVIYEHVGLSRDANTLAGFCEQFGIEMQEIMQPSVCATSRRYVCA